MAGLNSDPFAQLPIETNQHIASFLEYDQDLCSYRLICQSTLNAIDADNCSFWRRRFLTRFEKPSWSGSNAKYKSTYQKRQNVLKHGASFKQGRTLEEYKCLEVLRDLIVESFSSKSSAEDQVYESLNLQTILKFIVANSFLQSVFQPFRSTRPQMSIKPLLHTLQILCAPMLLSLEPHIMNHHFGFPDSQSAVYSCGFKYPLIAGIDDRTINMDLLLHNVNFWKYHMIREAEATLFQSFSDLDDDERPRWWNTQLTQKRQPLGRHWKGSYAYLSLKEVKALRQGGSDDQIQDCFAGEDDAFAFQDMRLDEVEDDQPFPWPPLFERHLQSLKQPTNHAKTRAQRRSTASSSEDPASPTKAVSFRFNGEGIDTSESFLATGWLNPLPPQQGIPGWQRVTMMKYFADEDTGSIDTEALWAYEGVVLPGGQIMLGRWWSVTDTDDEMYSGPFILWCVDGPKYDATEEGEETDDGLCMVLDG